MRTAEHLIEQRGVSAPSARRALEQPRRRRRTHPDAAATARTETTAFTADERRVLERVGDVLIPAGEGMPSASAAGLGDGLLDALLRARPDLAAAAAFGARP